MNAANQGDVRAAEQSREAREDVKSDLEALRANVSDLASSVKRLASAELGGVAGNAQEAAEKGMSEAERMIRRNPTQAALIAAGVGFLVGLVVMR